jgi:hypothetical protein
MQNSNDIEVTLKVSDIERVVKDAKIKEIVEDCRLQGKDIGACTEDAVLERLVDLFSEDGPPLKAEPMATWVNEGPADACRPCALPVAIQWYKEELEAEGQSSLATSLEAIALAEDPLTTAQEMDRLKNVVGPKLKLRLLDFDATTQANTP